MKENLKLTDYSNTLRDTAVRGASKQFLYTYLKVFLLVFFVIIALPSLAQKKVKLESADKLKGARTPDGERFERLIGNVVLRQNQTTIYCDSAHLYKKKNYVQAFGRVRILEGDSVTITGRKLDYDGEKKIAKMRTNVVFTKLATATLYTNHLDYDRPKNFAYYLFGGRLIDSINILTSAKGYYDVNSNMASFKREVVVKNPDYTMYSDSLQYNSRTKVIYFRTPTTVVNKDSSRFEYTSGTTDTKTKQSVIKAGYGESLEYKIESKEYTLDDARKIYKLRRDVVMTSKKENLIIYSQAADYYKNTGISKVYNNAYVAKVTDDNDTLFITADTLVSIDSPDPAKKRLLAYNNVRIYKSDLQGIADSLEYRSTDSIIYFYKNPILWSQNNQMTADSIRMLIKNNTIDRIFLNVNAFVISQDTLLNFNQIKGRKMIAEFRKRNIHRVYVEGNGETLYFVMEENKKDSVTKTMGMNKIVCSRLTIRFLDGKVNNLSFYVKPDGQFIPPHEIKEDDKKLRGFSWKLKQKPEKSDVVRSQSLPLPPQGAIRKRL